MRTGSLAQQLPVSSLAAQCATAHKTCRGCTVERYCSPSHQQHHYSDYKKICDKIKTISTKVSKEKSNVRGLFSTEVGDFWGVTETRPYIRACSELADIILSVNTHNAARSALDHFMDMLRLCRADNLGVRSTVPFLFLRLGEQQKCYDFVKWWATGPDDCYDWETCRSLISMSSMPICTKTSRFSAENTPI